MQTPAYDANNIFAKILRKEAPCHWVYEDSDTLVFMDIMPRTDGHALIIPKQPARNILDASPALLVPVIQTTQTIKPFLRDAPGNFIVKYRNPGSLAARVRKMLRALPMASWPAADQIALRLHVAEATMRRHLKQEGYTYQSIKDDLRRDIAIAELQDSRRSIAEIATRVGFAEPSAFHRAFRKWTGMRPTDYRLAQADLTRPPESD